MKNLLLFFDVVTGLCLSLSVLGIIVLIIKQGTIHIVFLIAIVVLGIYFCYRVNWWQNQLKNKGQK
jgi:hypothetical protein